jgi:hypothetical protein
VSGETPAEKLPAAPTIVTTETHKMRAKLAGWLRRVVIVVLALAVVKVFEAAFASLIVKAPANLHGAVYGFFEALRAIPGSLRLLAVERPVEVGQILPAERFLLGVGMLIYATRLVVRSKLLDAVYVTSARWKERTSAGLVAHFLMMLVIAGLLAWAASATKVPSVSDGLACGLIAVMLWVSAFWLMTLHLVAGNEYPELTRWMFTDAVIGVLVFIVALWPGLTILWSRAGATAVLLFVDSAVALHVGASFVFARRPIRWWWHKPLTIIISAVLIFLIAVLLACVR